MKNTVAFEGVGEEVGNFGSGKYAYIIKMPCANFPLEISFENEIWFYDQ